MNDDDDRKLVPPPLPTTRAQLEALRRRAPTPLEQHPAIQAVETALWHLSEAADDEDAKALPRDYPVEVEWFDRLHTELWEVFTKYMAEASPNRRIATPPRLVE